MCVCCHSNTPLTPSPPSSPTLICTEAKLGPNNPCMFLFWKNDNNKTTCLTLDCPYIRFPDHHSWSRPITSAIHPSITVQVGSMAMDCSDLVDLTDHFLFNQMLASSWSNPLSPVATQSDVKHTWLQNNRVITKTNCVKSPCLLSQRWPLFLGYIKNVKKYWKLKFGIAYF